MLNFFQGHSAKLKRSASNALSWSFEPQSDHTKAFFKTVFKASFPGLRINRRMWRRRPTSSLVDPLKNTLYMVLLPLCDRQMVKLNILSVAVAQSGGKMNIKQGMSFYTSVNNTPQHKFKSWKEIFGIALKLTLQQ